MDGSNAFHEAVISGNVGIVEMILNHVQHASSGFPSVEQLMNSANGGGRTARGLANTEEMKCFLASVDGKEEEEEARARELLVNRSYGALLELSITKYCGAHSIADVNRIFKCLSLEDKEVSANLQIGKRPRHEVFRGEKVKTKDLKDFEKLLERKIEISDDHPLSTLLNFAISK